MRRFVEIGLPNATLCRQTDGGAEDVELGKCEVGIKKLSKNLRQ